jgi:hypothetical protein
MKTIELIFSSEHGDYLLKINGKTKGILRISGITGKLTRSLEEHISLKQTEVIQGLMDELEKLNNEDNSINLLDTEYYGIYYIVRIR